MTRIRIPLADQIAYMERHREKGRELVKTKPETQTALDIAECIILTLTVYAAFEDDIRQQAKERNTG